MSVYNDSYYLNEAVESILNQKDVDLEFIIVNDGSTDDSLAILEHYEKQDSRIRLFNRGNQGLTKALIFGCKEARAEYIARQDADDISAPRRLYQQLEILKDKIEVGFVSCFTTCIGPSGEELSRITRPINSIEATNELLAQGIGPPAHGSLMFRRDLYNQVGGYRAEFYYAQDSDLWLRMVQRTEISYVPDFLYSYRQSLDSISVNRRDIQKRFGQLGQMCHECRLNNLSETQWLTFAAELRDSTLAGTIERQSLKKRLSSNHYFLGSCLQNSGNPGAVFHFWKTIQTNPMHWRAWIKIIAAMIYKFIPMKMNRANGPKRTRTPGG